MLIQIALRNIIRNKKRVIITALTIAAGLAFYIYINSLYSGMNDGTYENLIYLTNSSININTTEYKENSVTLPLDYGIKNYNTIFEAIKKNSNVIAATKRTKFMGEISNYNDSLPIIGIVIEPETDKNIFSLEKYIIKGHFFKEDLPNQIIIGKKIADDFQVTVGDFISLFAKTRYESFNIDDFEIIGILEIPIPEINSSNIFISYTTAEDFLSLDGLVTEIDILVHWEKGTSFNKYLDKVDKTSAMLPISDKDIRITTIRETSHDYVKMAESKNGMTFIILFIILIIASVGIINTVMMSVYERIREIGVLRALGLEPREILVMFIYEGIIIGIIGGILGNILGIFITLWLVNVGIDLTAMGGGEATGLMLDNIIYGQWNIFSFIFSFIFGIVVAFIASLIPARKALTLNVTNALRFQ